MEAFPTLEASYPNADGLSLGVGCMAAIIAVSFKPALCTAIRAEIGGTNLCVLLFLNVFLGRGWNGDDDLHSEKKALLTIVVKAARFMMAVRFCSKINLDKI